ncbi:putative gag-pol precursor [Panicum miliaceum]|uniref:Gag-pol n=1 Tax=Panicum miliaceum TaxID=4540 RepID=A0A3L6TDV2_PANMI|nr:putative gag-pol precursor [Panicum miliaceum]
MIGPLTTAPGCFTHILVAIDKFTKWIEYKPIIMLTPDRAVNFIPDIMYRFGCPNTIITDLGSNFTANQFWEFYENNTIEVKYVSVAHPRANGQVERANGLILNGLKKRLYDENSKKGGKWIYELSHVVWGLRTQPSKATGRTPFFLSTGLKLYSQQILCGSCLESTCVTKGRRTKLGNWNWILLMKPDARPSFSQPVICKASGAITTAMCESGCLISVTWSFAISRMKLGYTSSIHGRKVLSSCRKSQDQGHIACSTLMARKFPTPGI